MYAGSSAGARSGAVAKDQPGGSLPKRHVAATMGPWWQSAQASWTRGAPGGPGRSDFRCFAWLSFSWARSRGGGR